VRPYRDRADAGRALASHLAHLAGSSPVVLGIPRGGVVVAAEVAAALDGDLGAVIAGKVRAPDNYELAIGAVAPDGVAQLDELLIHRLGCSADEVHHAVAEATDEVARRMKAYGPSAPIEGRTVIVVDDGVATGATLRAALAFAARAHPSRLVGAVPVGPPSTIDLIAFEVDEVVCPLQPDRLWAVGEWYEDFGQVDDKTVLKVLGRD
jgi:putative phosphoribosyl transferase